MHAISQGETTDGRPWRAPPMADRELEPLGRESWKIRGSLPAPELGEEMLDLSMTDWFGWKERSLPWKNMRDASRWGDFDEIDNFFKIQHNLGT
jgi:hypothetical protein